MRRRFLKSPSEWDPRRPLSILGPTGSGKTRCVLDLVAHSARQALAVSLDSVAAYQELDIGSAKPRGEERRAVAWAGLDLFLPSEKISVATYRERLWPTLTDAPLIFVGGSHFYERALLEGQGPGQASDPTFLEPLAGQTNDELWQRLLSHDPRWQTKVHPNDRYRLERFSDLVFRQGLSFDELFLTKPQAPFPEIDTLILGLDLDLGVRLKNRIDEMLRAGWIDEVKSLALRYGAEAPALQSVGYREILQGLRENWSEDELRERILISHQQLAKKQRTWLRGMVRQKV